MNTDLTHLNKYSSMWVAVDAENKNKVMGSGKTLDEALKEARAKGCDNPFLTRTPKQYSTYIL